MTTAITDNERIEEIDVSSEMKDSFLEYAYSVIYARALPDARDGLKPVQRRIVFQMDQMGLKPDRGHVKSSRVVGEVMGKLHPHGDAPIYDALVRLAQPFNQRVALVDGHGNFGSLDDGPAAPRYTEARMDAAALQLTSQLDEDTVDFIPNYDNQFMQPEVLPAAFPNLLVNGAAGIAVGMATNIAPHNPGEALAAAIHLLRNPEADLEELMRFIPGPDFPGGGIIVDPSGIEDAYRTGRGAFKVRAAVEVERVSARRQGLVVTELPYMVGPERVIEKIKDAVQSGKMKGISGVTNLTDRNHGLRLVIDVKTGFNPEAVLAQLYKQTPLQESFSVNAVALVDGQPKLLTLKEMLEVFIKHRLGVVRRRSNFRLKKRRDRLHLVEGLIRAILDIDDVIAIIRSSDDAEVARDRLMTAFDLSEVQAAYILELRLRRLTKFSRLDLEREQNELLEEISQLEAILASPEALADVVADELKNTAEAIQSPRRTRIGEDAAPLPDPGEVPLEIADEPCTVLLTPAGEIGWVPGHLSIDALSTNGLIRSFTHASTRGEVAIVGADGKARRLSVLSLPGLPDPATGGFLARAVAAGELIGVADPIALFTPAAGETLGLGTAAGTVKRVRPEHPESKEEWEIIKLDDADQLVGCAPAPDTTDLVFVSAFGQLLRLQAESVRPQGVQAGGMAGIKLAAGDKAIAFASVPRAAEEDDQATVATVAVQSGTLAGTAYTTAKLSPLSAYPYKGRGTMGVRCQRFLKGEDALGLAWVGPYVPRAQTSAGKPSPLPEVNERRDASGTPLSRAIAWIG